MGENLLKGAGKYRATHALIHSSNKTDGWILHKNDFYAKVEPGKTYTFSCMCDGVLAESHNVDAGSTPADKKFTVWFCLLKNDDCTAENGGYWDGYMCMSTLNSTFVNNKVTCTYTIPPYMCSLYIRTNSYSNGTDVSTLFFWDFKLEEGTSATEWSYPSGEEPVPADPKRNLGSLLTGGPTASTSYGARRIRPKYFLDEYQWYTLTLCFTAPADCSILSPYVSQGYVPLGRFYTNGSLNKQIKTIQFKPIYYKSGETRIPAINSVNSDIVIYRFPDPSTISNPGDLTIHWAVLTAGYNDGVLEYTPPPEDQNGTSKVLAQDTITLARVDDGMNGVSVQNIVTQFYRSTSNTVLAGGSWSTTYPEFDSKYFVFRKDVVTYKRADGTTFTEDTAVILDPGWNSAIETYNQMILQLESSMKTITTRIGEFEEGYNAYVEKAYDDAQDLKNRIGEDYTNLRQTADEINVEFQKVKAVADKELGDNGTINVYLKEVKSYMTMADGTLTIGRDDSKLKSVFTNDKLSFVQGETEVAYFQYNKLYVLEAEFPNGAVFFDIGWVKHSNGSVSLRKVK